MTHKFFDKLKNFISVSFSERSITEKIDLGIIDAGVKSILDFGEDDLMPHFIYCGDYYYGNEPWDKLQEMFLTKMKSF